jgi:flavin-dependent dehydrogenase
MRYHNNGTAPIWCNGGRGWGFFENETHSWTHQGTEDERLPNPNSQPNSQTEKPEHKRTFHMVRPPLFKSGYGWAFPSKDELRLGCCASDKVLTAYKLKRAFGRWIKKLGYDTVESTLEMGIIGCGYSGHRFGRVFLAGDAAGLASPVTGEGIGQAMISGLEIAREILDSKYRSQVIPSLAIRHRRTHDFLTNSRVCRYLYALSPLLLKIGSIRKTTLKKYVI